MITVSSQSYRNQNIVNEKIKTKDFTVSVFTINSKYRMIIDGHHSLEAAQQEGSEPKYIETRERCHYKQELDQNSFLEFLEKHRVDCNYYDVDTDSEISFA